MNVNNLRRSFERFNTSANVLRGTGEPSISIDFTLWELEDIAELLYEKRSSVDPQPKTGYWIDADGYNAICGCCNRLNRLYGKYCRHCGARMVEPQESEVSDADSN